MPVGYSIYTDRPSYIHRRIDPRTKLAALGATFVLALAFNHPLPLALLVVLVLLIGFVAQLEARRLMPFLIGSLWFLVLGIVIWPLYVKGGPVLFRPLGQEVTVNGVLFGLAMGLRVALMVMAAGVWMMTTSPQKLTAGLLRMGLPHKAGIAMTAAIRFVPLLNAERVTISEARQARALDVHRGNPFSRAVRSIAIIGPLFIRAIDVAQSLALAMDARGFGARSGRTSIIEVRASRVDRLILVALLLLCIGAVIARLLGYGVITKDYL
ncbi:MAG: energy-coupling factor transporter transmembrane protein EcfT [Chloroflexota bacterium]|nr:energy-coupling factor transporter transmembrane protein EcfT [Chloroflexota bacterium]